MLELKCEISKRRRKRYQNAISYLPGANHDTVDELRNQSINDYLSDMAVNSSFHGINYICDSTYKVRRIIWIVVTLTAMLYAMREVYESTRKYLNYPVSTVRMKIYVDDLEFPAVSLCNLNDVRMSIVNGTSFDNALIDQNAQNISADDALMIAREARHNLEDMLLECKFNGRSCSAKNFSEFNWMQGDRCFTINSGKPGHSRLSVKGTGIKRNLELILNLQHYEYYRDEMESGIHFILHSQEETPVRMRGPIVSPGFTTYFRINKIKTKNLKYPYKTRCGSLNLKFFKGYSKQLCWLDQLTDYVNSKCGCKDFFMPGNISICTFSTAFGCMWPAWEEFEKKKISNCPLPCDADTYFGQTVSRALFPSNEYKKSFIKNLMHIQQFRDVYGNKKKELQFMRDNLLRIVLYYDDLSYELLEQKPSYDLLSWLGDIGGQIGLFVGSSAMSYFEFLDCLIMIIYAKYFKQYK
ncbi:acid-sensing ion channel 5-like [Hydra vulgaris]|uniref:Acid-sensing ion channel 5-like n=1 Tax=Hydra vulgaris TaxID=6087 RepID=A0A0A0MP67_HYDVU|nr:acid-sensing ion channel 5-like [Hydra vulgaris]CDG50529.1 Hydra sodium channel 8 [Hydra vulgaris]